MSSAQSAVVVFAVLAPAALIVYYYARTHELSHEVARLRSELADAAEVFESAPRGRRLERTGAREGCALGAAN